jgi:hypothetical protein
MFFYWFASEFVTFSGLNLSAFMAQSGPQLAPNSSEVGILMDASPAGWMMAGSKEQRGWGLWPLWPGRVALTCCAVAHSLLKVIDKLY